MEPKINTVYITRKNHKTPILTYKLDDEVLLIDFHVQFINLKPGSHKFVLNLFNQAGENMLLEDDGTATLDMPADGRQLIFGESVFYFEASKEELKDSNFITAEVSIDDTLKESIQLYVEGE